MSDCYPIHVTMAGMKAGEEPCVLITYSCSTLDAAMRKIHQLAAIHPTVDAKYDRETGKLDVTIGDMANAEKLLGEELQP